MKDVKTHKHSIKQCGGKSVIFLFRFYKSTVIKEKNYSFLSVKNQQRKLTFCSIAFELIPLCKKTCLLRSML